MLKYGNKKRATIKRATRKPRKTIRGAAKSSVKNVRAMVKKEISKNIENKITTNASSEQSILTINYDSTSMKYIFDYFSWSPENDGNVLELEQGTAQNQRIGNTIKLKRWVIKGSVYYDPAAISENQNVYFPQQQGYVDLYFGRQLNMANVIPSTLLDLYQNGGSTFTPGGQLIERTYSINKDVYKIYWHKRYKIGNSGPTTVGSNVGNNDYKLNQEFGFDICKLVCKNKILKYSDSSNVTEDQLVNSLTLFATFTMPNQNVLTEYTGDTNLYYSPVKISATSYAEYEDA